MTKYFSYIWKMLIIVGVTHQSQFSTPFFNNYVSDHGPGYDERVEPARLRYKNWQVKTTLQAAVRGFVKPASYIRNAIYIYCGSDQLSDLFIHIFISNRVMYAQPNRFS
jgi:hypothetical protein